MNTKKLLATAFAATLIAQGAMAMPANPKPYKVKQADGTTITIIQRGDEHGHVAFTEDGHPLWFNNATGNYEYATVAKGRMAGSGIIAADKAARDANAAAFVAKQDTKAILGAAQQMRISNLQRQSAKLKANGTGPNRIRINNFPSIGEQRTLVILVDFNNLEFSSATDGDNRKLYEDMMNEEGFTFTNGANGSARDYYVATSAGKFLPHFDVYGPAKLSKSDSYYGQNDYYGSDMNIGDLIVEACQALDDEIDFSKYDNDGDGYVDNVYFFYPGKGENDGGSRNAIWPHAFYLEDGYNMQYVSKDKNTKINRYTISNEINGSGVTCGIGTFVHEFGHVLGLADHYATDYGAGQYVDPGDWDAMASASYSDNGNTPPLFSGFERAELGWLEYTEFATTTDTLTTIAPLNRENKAYRVSVPGNENEYYIIENRQKEGWDRSLPGHGLLVWHIDMDENVWMNNQVNNNANHQRVDVVEADKNTSRYSYSGDTFPGTSNVTQFTFNSWDGSELFGFDGVTENADGTVSFLLAGAQLSLQTPAPVESTAVADSSLAVKWQGVPNAAFYEVNLTYEEEGKTKYVSGYENRRVVGIEALTIKDLVPDTEYEFSVTAGTGSFRSETATLKVRTKPLVFNKRRMGKATVTESGKQGFKAEWPELEGADSYELTLGLQTASEETKEQGYDFTEMSVGLPELWATNSGSYSNSTSNYGKAKPALIFNADGNFLKIAYPDTKIKSLSFWRQAQLDGAGSLVIETCVSGSWSEAAKVEVKRVQSVKDEDGNVATPAGVNETFNFDVPADTVRISYERTAYRVYLDDIVAECTSVTYEPVKGYDKLDVGTDLSHEFTGLEAGKTYSLTVTARQGELYSLPSEPLLVTLDGNTSGIEQAEALPSDGPVDIYDLQGRRMPDGANLPDGIYIVRKGAKATKVAIKN